jgi:hypothetical protein
MLAVATGWAGAGVLLNNSWIIAFCGDIVSCSIPLFSLALFVWFVLGITIGLVLHYWMADRARRRAR